MASPVVVSRIQNRRGQQSQFDLLYPPGYTGVGGYGSLPGFTSTNFPDVLLPGEIAFCTDSRRTFIGNTNGEYVELSPAAPPPPPLGPLTLLPLILQLPPVGVFTTIPALTYTATPFFTLLYDLTDNLSPDWNSVGTNFSRNGTLQLTIVGTTPTLTDSGTEINLTLNTISFQAVYSAGNINIQYMHNFAGNLTLSSTSIIWLPF